MRPLYSELSTLIQARKNCARPKGKPVPVPDIHGNAIRYVPSEEKTNPEWFDKHTASIESLVSQHLPSGSGFDSGTKIDLDASHADKLVFTTSYHHMNDGGFYDGWTEHTVTVTPALVGHFHLRISGSNRNEIKDYVHEVFAALLRTDVTYDLYAESAPEFKLRHVWENEDGTPSQCYQAWYVGEKRFWNNYTAAREYAGQRMYEAFMSRGKAGR